MSEEDLQVPLSDAIHEQAGTDAWLHGFTLSPKSPGHKAPDLEEMNTIEKFDGSH